MPNSKTVDFVVRIEDRGWHPTTVKFALERLLRDGASAYLPAANVVKASSLFSSLIDDETPEPSIPIGKPTDEERYCVISTSLRNESDRKFTDSYEKAVEHGRSILARKPFGYESKAGDRLAVVKVMDILELPKVPVTVRKLRPRELLMAGVGPVIPV